KVLGYVATSYARKSLSLVVEDIDRWFSFYPNIDGIFLDEVSRGDYNYYSALYRHIKTKSPNYFVVLNPGASVDNSYFNISDKIVVYEGNFQEFLNYKHSYFQIPSQKVCVIVKNVRSESDFQRAKLHGFSINSSCQYITDDLGPVEYFYVSSYLHLHR
ncbi:MAG: hypothetical protein D6699_06870, partial [Aquificota bacterium]